MSDDVLRITRTDWGVRFVLDRPQKLNALNGALVHALMDALDAAEADPEVRVIVLEGAGRAFCSGYDLTEEAGSEIGGPVVWRELLAADVAATLRFLDSPKPVIAQIHGYAIAGATELASACDLVYVADDAQISYPVVRVASPPDWQYHTVLLGMRRAMELMLTGDPITGTEAAQIGFANRAFPAEDLETQVLAIAGRVAGVPSDLQQINKRTIHRQMDVWGARAAIRAGSELNGLAQYTEAARAFRENALEAVKRTVAEQR